VDKISDPNVDGIISEMGKGDGKTYGIPWCINCCGLHPDHIPNIMDYASKMTNPQRDAIRQIAALKKPEIINLYREKSCMLCGRTYDKAGELDETWKASAKRVKEEFDRAGIFGVDDKKIELVVARCRKSVMFLFENRFNINPLVWEKFTFAGCLALIITHSQEARKGKLGTGDLKGPVR